MMRILHVLKHTLPFVIVLMSLHQAVLEVKRFGAKVGRVLNLIQFPYDGGTAHSTDTEHPKGDRCKNSACLLAFSCLRRTDVFDADSASRDAKLCRPRLGPTSTTFSAEEVCSKIASPSSPRRSVERCVFNFMSHCCFACKLSDQRLSASAFAEPP